ncbi:hypothetical protein HYPSUDRAFT_909841 [Hypholoma sublateritium FD-334 SS-4]|uniref:Uncharacterized protein n=1 Tax=Hypholoma sublateritium (strain FD-334 SS-4) TaxID=945553 RepID=A0A0D2M6Q8_HYPSF|nr:hypothetical protein HYPSUDRAFT_909841 [Hypholoma sublateritium FD-334 SS-4]
MVISIKGSCIHAVNFFFFFFFFYFHYSPLRRTALCRTSNVHFYVISLISCACLIVRRSNSTTGSWPLRSGSRRIAPMKESMCVYVNHILVRALSVSILRLTILTSAELALDL